MTREITIEEYRELVARKPKRGAPKLSEAEFQRTVLELAKLCGWRRAHFRKAITSKGRWMTPVAADGKGWPDLVMLRGARLIVAELKVPGNTTTPEQELWLDAFRQTRAEAYLWYPADWDEIERILA